MYQDKKIYILNTLSTGLTTSNTLIEKLNISGIIGLSNRETNTISGFKYLKKYSQNIGIDFIEVDDYTLNNENDKKKILSLQVDLLIIAGWQRLIPEWLINHCKYGVLGTHGSPYGITKGRGRSPQNWTFILNEKSFELALFKVDKGIDSGEIIDSIRFPISKFDDITTSYKKVNLIYAHLIIKNINCIFQNKKIKVQTDNPEYFPQRKAKDGQIDWNQKNYFIYNFIRALKKPYPGAYTYLKEKKITIWSAKPFEFISEIYNENKNGEILEVFNDDTFLVKTENGIILVEEYEVDDFSIIEKGKILTSIEFKEQMTSIIKRHQQKYPNLKISSKVLELKEKDL